MAETIKCPACQRQLQVPETYFGQQVQCPECRQQFVATPQADSVQTVPPPLKSSSAPPLEYDEPRRRRRGRDDDDDLDPDDDLGNIRHSTVPHRGGMILAMGLVGIVAFPFVTFITGPMAWVMGNTDLAEIRAGRMDPSGEGLVQAGRVLGIISTLLLLLGVLFFCAIVGLVGLAG